MGKILSDSFKCRQIFFRKKGSGCHTNAVIIVKTNLKMAYRYFRGKIGYSASFLNFIKGEGVP